MILISAPIVASLVALVDFRSDSMIEIIASLVVIWYLKDVWHE